jgi:hypothetical protein
VSYSKREVAHFAWVKARNVGHARPILGFTRDEMQQIRRERLTFVDHAIETIAAAHDTERVILSEPDDGRLDEMAADLLARREALAAALQAQ